VKSLKFKVKSCLDGFTLIEMMVVVLIFSIVGVLVTRSVALSLRNSRKSESIGKVRENIDYVLNVMEREIRNAESIESCLSTRLDYKDENGIDRYFLCNSGGYIVLNSATGRLTNPTVTIDCTTTTVFACSIGTPGVPDSVDININARSNDLTGSEGFNVSSSTKILLRTY
jgi:prepilin-type N-terminal cleavage/methylation domain-containing protein